MRNNTIRRRLTAGALALGIAGAGIAATTAAAPEASAKVDSGRYTFYERSYLPGTPPAKVRITGNSFRYEEGLRSWYRIQPTRNGGRIDGVGGGLAPATYILTKRPGGRYHIEIRQFGFRVGDGTLFPRR